MIKYLFYAALLILAKLLTIIITPVLPLFATLKEGPIDNNNSTGVEPRLPKYLSWFMTPDNSLWGDKGWQEIHCPNYKSYWGMVKWLYRNSLYGLSWSVLSYTIKESTYFIVEDSGDYLTVDKNLKKSGWFYITASNGAFQYRWVKRTKNWLFSFECGWLLDPYVKNAEEYRVNPKALLQLGLKMPKYLPTTKI